jgi:hypothetical protein
MGSIRRAPATVVACLLIGITATPLAAAKTVTGQSLNATGSLVYSWQASPALGCAAAHLCGVRGAAILSAAGADYLPSLPGQPAQLQFNQVSATARTLGPGPDAVCIDALPVNFVTIDVRAKAGAQRARLIGSGGNLPSAGRCSGPLQEDIARLAIPLTRTAGDRPSFDLRGGESENAGPFVVTLTSTLALTPGPAGGGVSESTGGRGSTPVSSSHRRREFQELVSARYQLAPEAGALTAAFRAVPAPACTVLGSCGTTGTVSLTPLAATHDVTLQLTRTVPRRPSRAAILRDLRAGRLSTGFVETNLPIAVSETLAGAVTCQSSRSETMPLLFGAPRGGVSLQAQSLGLFAGSGDILRSYCPGPEDSDLIGQTENLASGGIVSGRPGAPTLQLRLTRGRAFSGGEYSGRWGGALSLGLTRRALKVSTRPVVIG